MEKAFGHDGDHCRINDISDSQMCEVGQADVSELMKVHWVSQDYELPF